MPHWGWQASGPTNFFFSIYDRRPTNRGGDLSENYRRATCCNFSGEGNQRDTNTSPRRIPVQAIRKYSIWRRLMRAAGAVPIPLPKKAAFYQAPAERLAPDDCGQDGDNDNDVCRPSSSCYYHPPHPWRTHPPRPSPASPVGGGARRRRQRLGQRGGAVQVEGGRRQRQCRWRQCDGGGGGNR